MMRHYLIYLLPAICLLSACQSDLYEPEQPEAGSGEALEITVTETVNTASDTSITRSYEQGADTKFQKGDRVGIIILDKDGRILADNVPYKYDGDRWDFDEDNTDGKSRIYYDATMYKYIAYYPYTTQADVEIEGNAEDTKKKVKKLMDASVDSVDTYFEPLPLFKWRPDQSKEEDFRCCDPMVWSETYENGLPTTRNIEVKLSHIRNCFVLDPKVKWRLANGETIHYHPRNYEIALTYDTISPLLHIINTTELAATDTGFDDFYIYIGDYNTPQYLKYYAGVDSTRVDITYHAADGSYRYILGDDDEYTFNWEYTYRDGKTYGGVQTICPNETRNTRFFHEETIDMGYLMDDKVKVGDFYCCKNGVGYPLPYDAVDLLDPRTCVGVVYHVGFYVGGKGSDQAEYPEKVSADGKCHGYVMALTEATDTKLQWTKGSEKNPIIGQDNITAESGFLGYHNLIQIRNSLTIYGFTLEDFPAFYACVEYGKSGWHQGLTPPDENTSGWYLPAASQLEDIRVNLTFPDKYTFSDKENLTKTLATVRCKLPQDCEYLQYILPSTNTGWWSSSQRSSSVSALCVGVTPGSAQMNGAMSPTTEHNVRAALSY